MIFKSIQITSTVLVLLLVLAAFHQVLPGVCTANGAREEAACPLCNLIYTLVILVLVAPFVQVRPVRPPFLKRLLSPFSACLVDSLLFRGPPFLCG